MEALNVGVGSAGGMRADPLRGGGTPLPVMNAMSLPLIPADVFDARAPLLVGLHDKAMAMARAVVVEGRGLSDVARDFGVSRQYVDKCAKRVRTAFADLPDDWEHVEAWFPPEIAKTVRAMAEVALEQLAASKR